jgi:hypothetical protein
VIFRSLSTLAIFFTGLAKFDFGHCGFFALGLWIALFGIRSRYVPTMSRLCKILLFIVYALNFPWVDDPGMWTKSFGVTSINACEDTELFRYTWRTFGWPLLAVIATTCWSKAVDERTNAVEEEPAPIIGWTRLGSKRNRRNSFVDNAKHVCATGVLLATIYEFRSGSTILQAVTLVLAGILLTWKRTTPCRMYAMYVTQVWLVVIIVAKYVYKSVLFRVMFGRHIFPKETMLSWLGDFRDWAPEYSPRDLLDDIGLVTNPPTFWSASGGAMADILPEMISLIAIGALLRSNADNGAISVDPFRLLVATVENKWEILMDDHIDPIDQHGRKPIRTWCGHHAVLFKEDINHALRLVCITFVVWMGIYELSLFNFVYFVMGVALIYGWGHSSPTGCWSKALSWCFPFWTVTFGKVVPLIHLTSVYVWKLRFWKHVSPTSDESDDGSTLPSERLIFGCDANQTFTWIGLRGEVMRKAPGTQQYEVFNSTYVPLVVMLSLAVYDWLSQDGEADEEEPEPETEPAEPELEPEPEPEPGQDAVKQEKTKTGEEDEHPVLSRLAFARDKLTWLGDTITDKAIFVPAFYALLVWTPVLRGQADLVSGLYLFLLVCFAQSQHEVELHTDWAFGLGILCIFLPIGLCWAFFRWGGASNLGGASYLFPLGLGLFLMVWISLRKWFPYRMFAKGLCRNQMGLLFVVLCIRYAVYLGRPPDCWWLSKVPEHLVTRDATLRVWLGIANECVISRGYYQPCPVEDLFPDYWILVCMACYTRWTNAADALMLIIDNNKAKDYIYTETELRKMPHLKLLALAAPLNNKGQKQRSSAETKELEESAEMRITPGASLTDESIKAKTLESQSETETETVTVPRYGDNWLEHLQCLLWHAGGTFILQTGLLYGLLCTWAGADVKQGTSIWMCVFTWMTLRTFRHETSRTDSEQPDLELLKDDAKGLFRLACGAMFWYALTQPPLGTAVLGLKLFDWNFDTYCETRVWKALMILAGVPQETIMHSRTAQTPLDVDPSYLTMLATTALIALGLKTTLKHQKRIDIVRDQHKLRKTVTKVASDASANYIRPEVVADKLLHSPGGRNRADSTSAVETVSFVFEDVHTHLHHNWIDKRIHEQDSDTVLAAALKNAKDIDSSNMHAAPKLFAQVIVAFLSVGLLYALGLVISSWIPLLGSIYLAVLLFVVLALLFVVTVLWVEVRLERRDKEVKYVDDWIDSVVNSNPKSEPECHGALDVKKFTWLAQRLGVVQTAEEATSSFRHCMQEGDTVVDFDRFFKWYAQQEGDKPKLGRNALKGLKEKDQKKLVEKLPGFLELQEKMQAETTVFHKLPGFLQTPAAQFGTLAKSLAFALANSLVSVPIS